MKNEALKNGDVVGLNIPDDGIRGPKIYEIAPCPFLTLADVDSVTPPIPAGAYRIKVIEVKPNVIIATPLDIQGMERVEIKIK